MKTHLLALAAVTISLYSTITHVFVQHKQQFEEFISVYGKKYKDNEYYFRYKIYKESLIRVKEHNQLWSKGQFSYQIGINEFSDLTIQQFASLYLNNDLSQIKSNYACSGDLPDTKNLPDEYDWAARSAVTEVRKIGSCEKGGYAAATAQTIQSGRFITTGRLDKLSNQQIIDCSSSLGNGGCQGGNVLNSFQYVIKNGISSEEKYPFTGKTQSCKYSAAQKQWQILGCVKITPKNQTLIRAAVFRQPAIAAVNATVQKFKDYKSGVFQMTGILQSCKLGPSHYISIVGYGYDSSSKKKYWKLKNSWGATWGQQGYMFIVRNGDGDGECGIQNEVYYAID